MCFFLQVKERCLDRHVCCRLTRPLYFVVVFIVVSSSTFLYFKRFSQLLLCIDVVQVTLNVSRALLLKVAIQGSGQVHQQGVSLEEDAVPAARHNLSDIATGFNSPQVEVSR